MENVIAVFIIQGAAVRNDDSPERGRRRRVHRLATVATSNLKSSYGDGLIWIDHAVTVPLLSPAASHLPSAEMAKLSI